MKLVSGVDISGYDLVDEVDDSAEARRAGEALMRHQFVHQQGWISFSLRSIACIRHSSHTYHQYNPE